MPGWLNRTLALALLAAVVGAVMFYGILPTIRSYASLDAAIEQDKSVLARLQVDPQTERTLQSRLESLSSKQANRGLYLSGESHALAAADLQDRLRRIVQELGAELTTVQILPPEEEEGLTRVAIRAVLTTHLSALYGVLYQLESDKPYKFIENVEAQVRRKRRSKDQEPAEETLTVRFDVYGFLRPEQAG